MGLLLIVLCVAVMAFTLIPDKGQATVVTFAGSIVILLVLVAITNP